MIAGIASARITMGQGTGQTSRRARTRPRPDRTPGDEAATARPGPAPRTPRPGLDDLPRAEAPLAGPARIAAAARAFSAGNGYLTGLLVDRII